MVAVRKRRVVPLDTQRWFWKQRDDRRPLEEDIRSPLPQLSVHHLHNQHHQQHQQAVVVGSPAAPPSHTVQVSSPTMTAAPATFGPPTSAAVSPSPAAGTPTTPVAAAPLALPASDPAAVQTFLRASWRPCLSGVPTSIHLDLLAAGAIPDPFAGTNENRMQWVGEVDWLYRCEFEVAAVAEDGEAVEMVFEGLDTVAVVFLNGVRVFKNHSPTRLQTPIHKTPEKADNMFLQHRIDVSAHLKRPTTPSAHPAKNDLCILFCSAWHAAKQLESQHGVRAVWNGDASRVYLRKAQYHWGWDWGPTFVTCGVWKPARVEVYAGRVADVAVGTELAWREGGAVDAGEGGAGGAWEAEVTVDVEVDLRTMGAGNVEVEVVLHAPGGGVSHGFDDENATDADDDEDEDDDDDGMLVARAASAAGVAPATVLDLAVVKPDAGGRATARFVLSDPQLWWPAGQGGQPLYAASAKLRTVDGGFLDARTVRFGVRSIRLVENPVAVSFDLPPGAPVSVAEYSAGLATAEEKGSDDATATAPKTKSSTFFFEVNGRPVFCGGANWIPADNFLTRRGGYESYRNWLSLMVKGNQNMVRVWGGGIYESDHFYDLCDELGLLVWQDFMFACGSYPAYPAFRAQVVEEARQALRRLRSRPSLAILTGNNEDYAFAEAMGLGYDPEDHDEERWLKGGFPARIIYEKDLAGVVKELCPKVPYKPGSPWGGRWSSDPNTGDIHQWNVWHGSQEPYQNYGKLAGRFVSEFGMQGYPQPATFKAFFDAGYEVRRMHPVTAVVDHHNKATGFARRIAMYMFENFRYRSGAEVNEFIYATQLMQSEALSTAYRAWRREWRGRDQELVGGALVWQINDCWPCVSWAIVDYYYRPKPAYFTVRRELSPVVAGLSRDNDKVTIWINNTDFAAREVSINVKIRSVTTGQAVLDSTFVITATGNGTTEVSEMALPGLMMGGKKDEEIESDDPSASMYGSILGSDGASSGSDRDALVISAVVRNPHDNRVLSRATDWPQPLRHLPYPLPDPGLKVEVEGGNAWHDSETGLDQAIVRVSSRLPVKGVWLYVKGRPSVCPGVSLTPVDGVVPVCFDDNMLDVMPGDPQLVEVVGWKEGDEIRYRCYGDWEFAL
ncbi:hypothetical protein HDU96_005877 [Phlyctochytrium bullatum]|nr:hypothetical protein HDU96_005877 [Phlyctochytrium bullatum]